MSVKVLLQQWCLLLKIYVSFYTFEWKLWSKPRSDNYSWNIQSAFSETYCTVSETFVHTGWFFYMSCGKKTKIMFSPNTVYVWHWYWRCPIGNYSVNLSTDAEIREYPVRWCCRSRSLFTACVCVVRDYE